MIKFVIKLRTARYSHAGLVAMALNLASKIGGNLSYSTPVPSLIDFSSLIDDLSNAITAWGPPANRGSRFQYQVLLDARAALETAIATLANYCENTTPYDKTAFLSAGWEVKKEKAPVGLVGPVLNFHQDTKSLVQSGAVKLKWGLPADAPQGSVSIYRVMHSLTADINSATQMALTQKTTYTDLDAGTRPSNFYWIIPVCTAGFGGIADVVIGYPQGPVVS